MHRLLVRLLMVLALGMGAPLALASGGDDVYPLDTDADRERFQTLIKELRCPKCQNQNIADSDAPIATDMRDEVYRMVQDGTPNEEVVSALVDRFGEFVRYKPGFDSRTALLWLMPLIVVLIGVSVVASIVIRSRNNPEDGGSLSDEQRRQAEAILRDKP